MNKLLIILITCFLVSCVKTQEFTFTEKVSLINTSQNNVAFYFESSFGSDTLFTNSLDSVSFTRIETKLVESHFAGSTPNYIPIHIISLYEIYDLSDTLSYILVKQYDTDLSKNDSILLEHIEKNSIKVTGVNQINECRIVYNSFVYRLMQKDYTMLNKFKDYYTD